MEVEKKETEEKETEEMQIGDNPQRVVVPMPRRIDVKEFPGIPGIPLGPEKAPTTPAEMPTVPAENPDFVPAEVPAEAPAHKENSQGYGL